MQAELLLKVADYLGAIPPERFDMRNWRTWTEEAASSKEAKEDPEVMRDENLLHNCGTAACAFGWALCMPEVKQTGLTLKKGWPYFPREGTKGYEAIGDAFEISPKDAMFLFHGDRYPCYWEDITPAMVATHIRELVTSGGSDRYEH